MYGFAKFVITYCMICFVIQYDILGYLEVLDIVSFDINLAVSLINYCMIIKYLKVTKPDISQHD